VTGQGKRGLARGAGKQAVVAMRWKPRGRTWVRNRRINSWVSCVITR
jgi:hypothetical protein